MANLGQDQADEKGANVGKDKFHFLKNLSNEEIGKRDSDGTVKEFFDDDDIGVVQSSAVLQKLHSDEFKTAPKSENTEWVNKIRAGTVSFVIGRKIKVTETLNWSVVTSNTATEINAVTSMLSLWEDGNYTKRKLVFGAAFWIQVKNWLLDASTSFSSLNNKDQCEAALIKIKDDSTESYIEKSAGVDTSFANLDAQNVQDAINLIIGSSAGARKEILYDKQFYDFNSFYNEIRRVFNTTNDTLGPIFTSPIFGQFKNLTSQPHVISGVMANYQSIQNQSITGLSDTPSNYQSGQYLVSHASGFDFAELDQGSITFTGLSDTSGFYESGKYLRSTESGIEYADVSQNFIELSDTPTGFQDGKFLVSQENGIEYTGINFLINVEDRPSTELISGFLALDKNRNLVWKAATTTGEIGYTITGATHFTGLVDVPSEYKNGHVLESSSNGIQYTNIKDNYLRITDLKNSADSTVENTFVKINGSNNIVFSGANFIELLDTPSKYESGKFLVSDSDGIDFKNVSFLSDISDRPSAELVSGFLALDKDRNLVWKPATTTGEIGYTITGATHFTGLLDTPSEYDDGKFLKGTSNGLEYSSLSGQVSFLSDISDRPSAELVSGFLALDKDRNLVWKPATTTGEIGYTITGATHFTGLLDTPSEYDDGKFLKSTANGIEFTTFELSDTSFSGLKDTPGSYESGKFLISNTGNIEFSTVQFLENVSDRPSTELVSGFLALDKDRNLVWKPATTTGEIGYTITGATHFTGLLDTPSEYDDGKFLKSTAVGFELATISVGGGGAEALTGLSDAPTEYSDGKFLKSTAVGFELATISAGGGGIEAFTGLSDTPTGYSNGKFLKSTLTGFELEEINISATGAFSGLSDTPSSYAGVGGQYLRVAASEQSIEFYPISAGGGGGSMVYPKDINASLNGKTILANTGNNTFKKIVQGPNITLSDTVDGIIVGADFPKSVGTLISLSDTPAYYSANKFVKVNSNAAALEFVDVDLSIPVGSGFAKHNEISTKDSFDMEMPEHVYLKSSDNKHVQAFAFTQYKQDPNGYIEYAPTRSGVFGSYIQFNDNSEGSYKESDASVAQAHNELSLSGFISAGRAHYEAARNTGVYNQGLRAVLHAGSAELEEDLSIEPDLQNVIGSYNNWTQLSYDTSFAKECKWTIPQSLTKNYLSGEVEVEICWISEKVNGNIDWQLKMEEYSNGDDIDAPKASTFRSIISSSTSQPNGIINAKLLFKPSSSELKPSSVIVFTLKRNPLLSSDTLLGDANVLFASITENI